MTYWYADGSWSWNSAGQSIEDAAAGARDWLAATFGNAPGIGGYVKGVPIALPATLIYDLISSPVYNRFDAAQRQNMVGASFLANIETEVFPFTRRNDVLKSLITHANFSMCNLATLTQKNGYTPADAITICQALGNGSPDAHSPVAANALGLNFQSPVWYGAEVALTHVLEIAQTFTVGSQKGVNVTHWLCAGTPDVSVATADAWAAAAWASGGPFYALPSQVALEQVALRDLTSLTNPSYVYPESATGAGTLDPVNSGGALVLTFGTDGPKHKTKGRLFFGPLSDNMVDPGGSTAVDTFRSDIASAWEAVQTAMASLGAGYTQVIVDRKHGTYVNVLSVGANKRLSFQRRRQGMATKKRH